MRAMALIVLLGAILPNVTYVGHWSIRGLEAAAAGTSADGHANHCHGSSACADQAAYGLQWWSDAEATVSLDSGLMRAGPRERDTSASDGFIAPPERPPQNA